MRWALKPRSHLDWITFRQGSHSLLRLATVIGGEPWGWSLAIGRVSGSSEPVGALAGFDAGSGLSEPVGALAGFGADWACLRWRATVSRLTLSSRAMRR